MTKSTWMTACVIALVTMALGLAGCNGARKTAAHDADVPDAVENQQVCPVMDDMPINKDHYVDHEGQRVYFCCAGCISTFQGDPDRYMEKLKDTHADPDPELDPEDPDPELGLHDSLRFRAWGKV